jgi:hypothetical protein
MAKGPKKLRITVEFDVSGPDVSRARDAVEAALDAGTIQDAIVDAVDSIEDDEEIDFTIEDAQLTDVSRIGF